MTDSSGESTLKEMAIITSFVGLTISMSLFPLGLINIDQVLTPVENGIKAVNYHLPDGSEPENVSHPDSELIERHLQRALNNKRIDAGYQSLERNDTLNQIAHYHAADMAEREYLGLKSPEGKTVQDRMRKYGYTCERSLSDGRIAKGGEFVARIAYGKPLYGVGETLSSEREIATEIIDRNY